ncbi:MAG: SGNH/GDSL hydrolase family protein [Anaerolineae bacterium]|nr:SGNH/GDSL hydrolase family protein [Anaerolineae bacterium]MDW8171753.1 SGNH/GDSL hydrolase family protein [Anaerolineae bacterium]
MRRLVVVLVITTGLVCAAELAARLILWRYNNPYDAILQPQYQIFRGIEQRGTEGDFPPNDRSIWLSWTMRPYTVTTNSGGLRNLQDTRQDAFRILAVGDSFTFGAFVGDHDTWPFWLESILMKHAAELGDERVYQVLNAGVGGYTISDELAYMNDKGFALRPDLVILGFTPNDIAGLNASLLATYGRPATFADSRADHSLIPDSLQEQSALLNLFQILRFQIVLRGQIRPAEDYPYSKVRESEEKFYELARQDPSAEQRYREDFQRFADAMRSRGIDWIVVAFPFMSQLAFDAPRDKFSYPQQIVEELARANDVPFLNLLPIYQAVGDPEALYLAAYDPLIGEYMGDTHPSRYGNRVAAQAIFRMLTTKGLIPLAQGVQSGDS